MLKQYWFVETMEVGNGGMFVHKFYGREGFEGIDITPDIIREYGYSSKSDAIYKMDIIREYIINNNQNSIVTTIMYYA